MRKKIDTFIGSFLTSLMGIMLIAVLWQIFTRYILGSASTFTEELARFLLIWIGLLGAAFISGKDMHLAIDILPTRLTGSKKRRLMIVIKLIIILFAVTALIIGGAQLVYTSFILGQTSAALQIPMGYVYLVIPISGLLICYYKCSDISKSVQFYKKNSSQPETSNKMGQ